MNDNEEATNIFDAGDKNFGQTMKDCERGIVLFYNANSMKAHQRLLGLAKAYPGRVNFIKIQIESESVAGIIEANPVIKNWLQLIGIRKFPCWTSFETDNFDASVAFLEEKDEEEFLSEIRKILRRIGIE